MQVMGKRANGACKAGLDKGKEGIVTGPSRSITAYCVEPLVANIQALNRAFDTLRYTPSIRVVRAAVTSTVGTTKFAQARAGFERSGLAPNADVLATIGGGGSGDVNVTTLDDMLLLSLEALDKEGGEGGVIDVLSIDTEGNDARVIFGAVGILGQRRVRYLEFEYHENAKWATSNLEDVADLLDQFGFDCYFPGNKGQLWRLTGCWDESYDKRAWSNVACVHRGEVKLAGFMEAHAASHNASWH